MTRFDQAKGKETRALKIDHLKLHRQKNKKKKTIEREGDSLRITDAIKKFMDALRNPIREEKKESTEIIGEKKKY